MINFTVGPVQSFDYIKSIGAQDVPYFRTAEFSEIMLENERLMLKFSKAPEGSKAAFMTGSGTASMEAAVINTLSREDKVLVVDGGSFGHRFCELLSIHEIPFTAIRLPIGKALTREDLEIHENQGYTAFLVNIHETSTGVHYDIDLISDFCKRNHLFLIVDAISSFLADEFDMAQSKTDIMIVGSQKALSCPPGISVLVLSPEALKRIAVTDPKCMYLNLKSALENQKRGQTPFTPAVSVLLQINARLKEIEKNGGVDAEVARVADLAGYFRKQIESLPFKIVSDSLSNAVTPLYSLTANANDVFIILKDEYNIWVCPNGGEMKDKIFRVGHLGNLKKEDYDLLIAAFQDLQKRGII